MTEPISIPVQPAEQGDSGWFADYVTVSRDFAMAIAQRDEWRAKWQASNAETLRHAAELARLRGLLREARDHARAVVANSLTAFALREKLDAELGGEG